MAKKEQSPSLFLKKFTIFLVAGFFLINSCIASAVAVQVCETPGCTEAAHILLKNMDQTIDPCNDFYQFACGTFAKETIIPEYESNVSIFGKKTDVLQSELKKSIEGKLDEGDPQTFKLLQSYYNTCLNTEKIESTSIEEVNTILSNLGNWPVLFGESWSESNFDWQKLIYQLRKIGYVDPMNSIIKVDIETNPKNTTRSIITLDQAVTGLDQEYLSKGREDKIVQAYSKYMVELAKILGANQTQAEKELSESLNFEIELAKISLAKQDRTNMSELYNLKTVMQLESEYPNIPWNEYLNQLVSPQSHVNLTDEVIVRVPSFLKSLSQLLSKTPKRVLANYIIWRVVHASTDYMNEQVRKVKAEFHAALRGTTVQKPRWVQCIEYITFFNKLPVAAGSFYVRKNFDKKTKNDAVKLVTELRKSFENMLIKIDWMDEETKKAAQSKLKSIIADVAYPEEFLDDNKLDKLFESLKVDENSFLKSDLQLNLFNWESKLKELRIPVDKMNLLTGLRGVVAFVDAFFEPTPNSIRIPAGILQGEFFTTTRPNYMNYGALGWIIGHEFTHGFDDQGSQYDKDGNLVNWWNIQSREEFSKRAQCLTDQYNNYTVKEVDLNINGKNTLGENIADNGGVKEAYYAYVNYEKQNGEEPRLPGLPYSPRQLFWISGANVWCKKFRPEGLRNRVITDVHSTGEFRVIGSFSNMLEFSTDFNCPAGSPMNPIKKCTVW